MRDLVEELDLLRIVVRRAHGALADAGTVKVPGQITSLIDRQIRQITAERDAAQKRLRELEEGIARLRAPVHDPTTCRVCRGRP